MLKKLVLYIITNGTGKEAVKFYQEALGATVNCTMYWKDQMPEVSAEQADLVMNAQLSIGDITFMISDENPDVVYTPGKNMSATLIYDNVEEATAVYHRLSYNAQSIDMEIQETFWSPAYANFTDQYGVLWQISTEIDEPKS